MRSALVLAALSLAVPGLASAQQTAGTIQFTPDATINLAECSGNPVDPDDRDLTLTWTAQSNSLDTTFAGTFQVFASSRAPPTGTNERFCPDDGTSTDFEVNPVGDPVIATSASGTQVLPAADFVTAAGFTCDDTTNRTIHVCVHFVPTNAASPTGWAYQTLTLSVRRPVKPEIVSVEPAEEALRIRWQPGSGGETSRTYVVQADADPVDPAGPTDPVATHWSREIAATETRLGGLVNGVRYRITVKAFSEARNESPLSDPEFGTPVPVSDFWEYYDAQEGREQGGCASGTAGPAALLALLALALVRRRS